MILKIGNPKTYPLYFYIILFHSDISGNEIKNLHSLNIKLVLYLCSTQIYQAIKLKI